MNVYIGPGDGGADRVFLRALRALVVFRTENAHDRQSDLDDMLRLQARLDSLGRHVPIIGMKPARFGNSDGAPRAHPHARPGHLIGLSSGAPYYLELLAP